MDRLDKKNLCANAGHFEQDRKPPSTSRRLRRTARRYLQAGAIVAASATALTASLFLAPPAANADTSQIGLPPDLSAYCITHPPFALQSQVNDWVVSFSGILGAPGANNWGCGYQIIAAIPAGRNSFTVPLPIPYTAPIDFRDLCAWQYPGATTDWSTAQGDWTCIGKPGRSYGAQGFDGVSQYSD